MVRFPRAQATNIVNLADVAFLENSKNSSTVVFDVRPIALLLAIAINRD
jgi:hypothetical protein